MSRYDNILQTVGRTPVVRINKLAPEGVNLYVKVESFNPLGSVKDRLALGIIEDAERKGRLKPGQTVIEATSGNTGIGLAMVCAQKGYPLVIVMAENFSIERRKMMRYLGARVVLTPAAEKGIGMLAKAVELAETHGWFLCRQFENEANAEVHSRTTAREIIDDFAGERLDYWVSGFGTGGTLKGVARVLAAERPETKVVVCEPDNSAMLGSGVEQQRTDGGGPAESHPSFRPHVMQGISPDFIPRLTQDVLDEEWIDRVVPVGGADAMDCSRRLAQQEGIFAGISGGATFAAALEVCRDAPAGSTVLCMLPDTGERYLSTPLFEPIESEMNADELEISLSTPTCRFGAPTDDSAQPASTAPTRPVTAEGTAFVEQALSDAEQPVVLFALEWCEFCWSVRKFFKQCGIPYRAVDLDSVAYQQDDFGGQIRAALSARTSIVTIPQVFVGGELLGGCNELFDAHQDGSLWRLLDQHGVDGKRDAIGDARTLLPGWAQR